MAFNFGRDHSILDVVEYDSGLLVEDSAKDEVTSDIEDQHWDCDEGRSTNGTVTIIHRIEWVVEAHDCNLTEDYENTPKASLPEYISTSINDALADSTKTFAHETVEKDLAAEIEDQAETNR